MQQYIDILPDTNSNVENIIWKDQVLTQTKIDIAMLQSEWDNIASQELKLQQKRQKAIDKTELAMLRNVQAMDFSRNNHEKHIKSDKPTIDMDSG